MITMEHVGWVFEGAAGLFALWALWHTFMEERNGRDE